MIYNQGYETNYCLTISNFSNKDIGMVSDPIALYLTFLISLADDGKSAYFLSSQLLLPINPGKRQLCLFWLSGNADVL